MSRASATSPSRSWSATAGGSPGAIGRVCLAIFGLREGAVGDTAAAARARGRPRRGAAADQHPARRARGRRERPRLPARRGSAPLRPARRRRAAPVAALARALARGERAAARGGHEGGEAFAELVHFEAERAREWFERGHASWCRCSTAAAPPACWRWPGSTGACSSGSTPDPAGVAAARMSLPAREKASWSRPGMLGGAAR